MSKKTDSSTFAGIAFTGVKFTGFHFVPKPKRGQGGPSLRVFFEADWLEPTREVMGWQDVDRETVRGTLPLRGALIGSQIALIPIADGLAQHTVKLRAQAIRNFEVFFPEQTGKKEKPPVLRFRLETHEDKAEAIFGQWGRILGEATSQLEIEGGELKKSAPHDKDEPEDKQEPLPLTGAALDEHRQQQQGHKQPTTIRKVKPN